MNNGIIPYISTDEFNQFIDDNYILIYQLFDYDDLNDLNNIDYIESIKIIYRLNEQ